MTFDKAYGINVRSYGEQHVEEQNGNMLGTWWEHIGNMLGTWWEHIGNQGKNGKNEKKTKIN